MMASMPSRSTSSMLRISPWTTVSAGCSGRKLPNHWISKATTSCPLAISLGTRTLPLYPQPPVTRIFIAPSDEYDCNDLPRNRHRGVGTRGRFLLSVGPEAAQPLARPFGEVTIRLLQALDVADIPMVAGVLDRENPAHEGRENLG